MIASLRGWKEIFDRLKESQEKVLEASLEAELERQTLSRARNAFQALENALPMEPFEKQPKAMYIPVLRGLRLFNLNNRTSVQEDFYQQRTESDYFQTGNKTEIFTGYTLYSHIRDLLLGNQDERRRVKEYENFLSGTFFERKEVTLTPAQNPCAACDHRWCVMTQYP